MFLSDADFESVFGMDKAAWEKMPAWKRKNKKKEAGHGREFREVLSAAKF